MNGGDDDERERKSSLNRLPGKQLRKKQGLVAKTRTFVIDFGSPCGGGETLSYIRKWTCARELHSAS